MIEIAVNQLHIHIKNGLFIMYLGMIIINNLLSLGHMPHMILLVLEALWINLLCIIKFEKMFIIHVMIK
jgi:hypothetical protein